MGCVYIPPENSLYSSINAFLDIENELVNFIEKDMKCAVVGDFLEPDETFLNVMDVNVEDGLFRYHIAMTTKFYLIIIFPQKDILSVNADQIILDENF